MGRLDWLTDRVRRFAELRRALPLAAAAMLVGAIILPAWRITLEAPQYRDALTVDLFAYPRLGGDFEEVQLLNHYVGFYYPDPVLVDPNFAVHENAIAVPEWTFGWVVFLAVAAVGVFVALAPTERKLRLGLTGQLVGTLLAFGGMFAIIQYRLYQAGHALDPDAPLVGYDGFTPPVFGSYEIANISGFASLGPGGYLATAAVVLLVLAFLLRNNPATVTDTPSLARGAVGRINRSIVRRLPGRTDHDTQPGGDRP